MRELHVVAVSEDGRHVLLAGKKGSTKGGFRVALDERLLSAARGDLRAPGEEPEGPELTPKDIQARLRAGESAESIARSAGVPLPRVERFSGPVQGEMARMIDAARSAHLVRGRLGRSALPLGRAVQEALLQSPSLREDSIEWETYRQADGTWRVTVSWFARARVRSAAWVYDPHSKTLTATDPASAALGHHDPDAAAPAKPRPTAGTPVAAPAPARPAAKKAAAKKQVAKKPVAKKPVAKAPAKKAPAKKAPATKAPAKKAAAAKAPAAKAAKAPAKKAPAARKAVAPVKKAAPVKRRALRVVPDPVPAAPAKARQADRDGVTTRASVPAWADVLLGTTPGGDR